MPIWAWIIVMFAAVYVMGFTRVAWEDLGYIFGRQLHAPLHARIMLLLLLAGLWPLSRTEWYYDAWTGLVDRYDPEYTDVSDQ